MSFLKFLKREMLIDRMFNIFFILCFSLGMTGLLFVESFREGVSRSIELKAKNYAASDLIISSRREISNEDINQIKKVLNDKKIESFFWYETYSLAGKNPRLSNLQFVSSSFPFYGGIKILGEEKIQKDIFKKLHFEKVALVASDIAIEQNLKVNDSIKIGNIDFKIIAIVESDLFTSMRGFTLAPKIYVSYEFMEETGLVKFGSTVSRSIGMSIHSEKEALKVQKALKDSLSDKTIKVQTPVELSSQMSRSIELLSDYLSLITLLTYLLSLIGLFYFTKHYLSKRMEITSIYRALGIKKKFIFQIQITHIILLMLLGYFISLSFCHLLVPILKSVLDKDISSEVQFLFSINSISKTLAIGILGGVFCIGPLIFGTLKISVASIFQGIPSELKNFSSLNYLPLFVFVVFLSVLLSHSIKVGLIFVAILLLIVFIKYFIFKGVVQLIEKVAPKLKIELKHTLLLIARFFYTNFIVLVSIMLGAVLLIFVIQIEQSFVNELVAVEKDKKPDLFMFDLQDRDIEKFLHLKEKNSWELTQFSPMIRGRLLKVNERNLVEEVKEAESSMYASREEEDSNRMKNRSVNLSYRQKLSWSEKIVKGKWNSSECVNDAICEISLEERYAGRIGAKLNDVLTFDISGVEIKGKVTSFRSVKWTSFEPNFFILFQKGAIDEAPKTFLGSFKTKNAKDKRLIFTEMANNFKSTSLIDLNELITKLIKMFDLVSFAIKFISLISLFTAMTVVLSISFHHLDMREKDFMLFKLIGLKTNHIRKIFVNEFFLLVLGALTFSYFFGTVLSYVILKFGFNMQFEFELKRNLIFISVFLGLTLISILLKVNQILKKENKIL